MARPRVFVSSTYYDLKHIRSSLDLFIESLGYDSILSEKGDIAYGSDEPLDQSCYREVDTADLFVLIIGSRYGSEASGDGKKKPSQKFFRRYESITKREYESAVRRDLPIYIMVESGVYAEYHTYRLNKQNRGIKYAHVDSVNVFRLLEVILSQPRNNAVRTFEKFADIEGWLREQWSGLFRDLLNRRSQQQQITALSHQVASLKETNETLRKYLEAMMATVSPDKAKNLIESENKRLEDAEQLKSLYDLPLIRHVMAFMKVPFKKTTELISSAHSLKQFATLAVEAGEMSWEESDFDLILDEYAPESSRDLNQARNLLGLEPLPPLRLKIPRN